MVARPPDAAPAAYIGSTAPALTTSPKSRPGLTANSLPAFGLKAKRFPFSSLRTFMPGEFAVKICRASSGLAASAATFLSVPRSVHSGICDQSGAASVSGVRRFEPVTISPRRSIRPGSGVAGGAGCADGEAMDTPSGMTISPDARYLSSAARRSGSRVPS